MEVMYQSPLGSPSSETPTKSRRLVERVALAAAELLERDEQEPVGERVVDDFRIVWEGLRIELGEEALQSRPELWRAVLCIELDERVHRIDQMGSSSRGVRVGWDEEVLVGRRVEVEVRRVETARKTASPYGARRGWRTLGRARRATGECDVILRVGVQILRPRHVGHVQRPGKRPIPLQVLRNDLVNRRGHDSGLHTRWRADGGEAGRCGMARGSLGLLRRPGTRC